MRERQNIISEAAKAMGFPGGHGLYELLKG
jgi:hypothetical protein